MAFADDTHVDYGTPASTASDGNGRGRRFTAPPEDFDWARELENDDEARIRAGVISGDGRQDHGRRRLAMWAAAAGLRVYFASS